MKPFEYFLLVMAVWQALEVWHHGSVFSGVRAWIDAFAWNWFSELASCMFCLSVWIGAFAAMWFLITGNSPGCWLPVYALAIARGANLLNDLTWDKCRTPGRSDTPL